MSTIPAKILCFFFLLFISFPALQAQGTGILISGKFENVSISEFIQRLENEYSVKIYFKEDHDEGLRINGNYSMVPLSDILRENLLYTDFDFILINNRTAGIYKKTSHAMPTILPGFESVGNPSNMNGSKKALVEGIVIDGNTGTPIFGANIYVRDLKFGTITDQTGRYQLSVRPGKYEIEVSSVGFLNAVLKVIVYSSGTLNTELYSRLHEIEQVEISASGNRNDLRQIQMSSNSLSMKRIKEMPTFLGETDVVKSIIMLPGVSSSGESASGINIRGGNADQNLFLMDEIPLFNFTHLFGFFSAINPDIVEEVTVYKGAIPPSYGGRLASVVDISLVEEVNDKILVKGSAGIIASRLSLNIPLLEGNASVLLSGRASYADWLLKKTKLENLSKSTAGFHDANLRFSAKTSEKGRLSINSYTSRDRFNFENEAGQKYGTDYLQARHTTLLNSRLSSIITAFYGEYRSELTETADSLSSSGFTSGIDLSGFNYNLTYFPSDYHKISMGMNNLHYLFHPGKKEGLHPASGVHEELLPVERALESAMFISHEFNGIKRLSVSYGLRLSFFLNFGGDQFLYEDNFRNSSLRVIDTLHYKPLEVNSSYINPEPRLSAKYMLSTNSSIKASYSRTIQYIHLLSNTTSITPSDIWKPSGRIITPQKGDQLAAGYYAYINGLSLQFSLETYYKWIGGINDLRGGSELLMNPLLEAELIKAEGRAYGIELMLKKEGRLNGWISYSYSKSERKTVQVHKMFAINNGMYYPADFDKPHDFKLVMNYKSSARMSFSVNYVYSSGRPVTYPEGYYTVSNIPVIHYSEKNAYRIPDYKRLDLSVNYDFYNKKTTKYESGISFSIYNLLSNDNSYSVFFRNEQNIELGAYRVLLVNKPVPAVSYYFRF